MPCTPATPGTPPPAKLLLAVLYRDGGIWRRVAEALQEEHGPLDDEYLEFPFTETDYYEAEMGAGLTRRFCTFTRDVAQDRLAALKRRAAALEGRFAGAAATGGERRRRVNLDPGLLSCANVVLASTKNFTHRVYLRDGIHAEVTLLYRDGGYEPLPWTYPDYRRPESLDFFNAVRGRWRSAARRRREP